jgi:thermitase
MIRRLIAYTLSIWIAISLAACNINARPTTQQPSPFPTTDDIATEVLEMTNTPAPTDNRPPAQTPVLDSNCLPIATTTGVLAQRGDVQFTAQQSLPNGQAFPFTPPVRVGVSGEPVPNRVLIRFTPTSSQARRDDYLRTIGGDVVERIDALNTVVVENSTYASVPRAPIVAEIEPEYQAGASQNDVPSDPRYGEQWAFNAIDLQAGWGAFDTSNTVVVAVIDSGICGDHPDLQGRIMTGFDFVQNDVVPQDEFGHGCSVAGVIAANPNNDTGIAGIAPNVQIMPLRVLDDRGLGGYAGIAQAIIYAADNNADIINLSLAGPRYSQILADAVAYAIDNGVIVVAAAGNQGVSATYYPAGFPDVIAVGATNSQSQRANFSNYGETVMVYAPGQDILATNIGGDYEMQSGTSFAAPIVTGMIALVHDVDAGGNRAGEIGFLQTLDNCVWR